MSNQKNNATERNGIALPKFTDLIIIAWVEYSCAYCRTNTAPKNEDVCVLMQMPFSHRLQEMEAKMRAYADTHPIHCQNCRIDMQPKTHIIIEK